MKFQDYYTSLGVSKTADDASIKKAYRKLARQYHPDVNKAAGAETKFKEISEAYEVLGDPVKRKKYDSLGANWQGGQDFKAPPGGGFRYQQHGAGGGAGGANPFGGVNFNNMDGMDGAGGFSDFFESLFGGSGFGGGPGGRAGARKRSPGRGIDHESEITVSLEDACLGAVRSITLTAEGDDGEPIKNSFEFKLPRGTPDGAKIRVPGKGGPGRRGGQPGDLFLRVHIAQHPIFRVNGRDIEEDLPISPWEAVLGAELEVKTIDGTSRIRLKPGTQSGQKIRLKGKGLSGQKDTPDGDLYALVKIIVPENPTAPDLELFKKLSQTSHFNPRHH